MRTQTFSLLRKNYRATAPCTTCSFWCLIYKTLSSQIHLYITTNIISNYKWVCVTYRQYEYIHTYIHTHSAINLVESWEFVQTPPTLWLPATKIAYLKHSFTFADIYLSICYVLLTLRSEKIECTAISTKSGFHVLFNTFFIRITRKNIYVHTSS